MANKNLRKTKGKKGKKHENKNHVNQVSHQDCDSLGKNVSDQKIGSKDTAAPKANAGRVTRNRKAVIKSNGMEIEPVAGPSGLTRHESKTIAEESMVVCKYKQKKATFKSQRPYEVMWGQTFLTTLVPKAKKGKSILKSTSTEKRTKSRTRFSQTTVYYFERAHSRYQTSAEGQVATGMEKNHFCSSLFSVDQYEEQKELRFKQELGVTRYKSQNERTLQSELQQGQGNQNVILDTIQVPTELMEEEYMENGHVKEVHKGCSCNTYCDPDMCQCNLNGKQCKVFMDGFPCGCKLEYCKNANGRVEYNNRYVKSDVGIASYCSRVEDTKDGRVNKRKQLVSTCYSKY